MLAEGAFGKEKAMEKAMSLSCGHCDGRLWQPFHYQLKDEDNSEKNGEARELQRNRAWVLISLLYLWNSPDM